MASWYTDEATIWSKNPSSMHLFVLLYISTSLCWLHTTIISFHDIGRFFLAVYQCDWYRGQSYQLFNARTCWLGHHVFPTVHSYEVDIIHAFIHSFIWLVLGPAGDFYLLKSVPLKMLHAQHSIPVTVQWFVFNMFLQTFVTLAQIPELNWRWNLLKIEFLICNVYSL